jgi:hypothetical protein
MAWRTKNRKLLKKKNHAPEGHTGIARDEMER